MAKEGLTEIEFQKEMKKAEKINEQRKRAIILEETKRKYDKPKFETSKIIAIYLFVLLNAIVIYSMFAMWMFADFTYLGVLISDIAAQVIIYAIYCMKAYHAKKQSEQIKFDRERYMGTFDNILDAGIKQEQIDNELVGEETNNDEAVG